MGFRKGDLKALNRCRLFLQVTMLADISTGCGRQITPKAWAGQFEVDLPRQPGWSFQSNPTTSDWGLWRKALQQLSQSSPRRSLPVPLGRWTHEAPTLAWHYSRLHDRLYRQVGENHWVYHTSKSSRSGRSAGRRFTRQAQQVCPEELPPDLLQGRAFLLSSHITLTGFSESTGPPQTPFSSFATYVAQVPPSAAWVFRQAQIHPQSEMMGLALSQGTCRAVSDGSFRETQGAASWIICDSQDTEFVTGAVRSPGLPSDQTALRSELTGIYAAVLTIHHACRYFQLASGTVELGCDSQAALFLSSSR